MLIGSLATPTRWAFTLCGLLLACLGAAVTSATSGEAHATTLTNQSRHPDHTEQVTTSVHNEHNEHGESAAVAAHASMPMPMRHAETGSNQDTAGMGSSEPTSCPATDPPTDPASNPVPEHCNSSPLHCEPGILDQPGSALAALNDVAHPDPAAAAAAALATIAVDRRGPRPPDLTNHIKLCVIRT